MDDVVTYYQVSGGPVRITCHSNGLESSTSPAEKPESVFLFSSEVAKSKRAAQRSARWSAKLLRHEQRSTETNDCCEKRV